MSCAVYMTACPPYLLSGLSRAPVTILPSAIGQHCIENSWIDPLEHINATVTELYTTSAYFAVVTFMTVGFGDYSAANFYEVITSYNGRIVCLSVCLSVCHLRLPLLGCTSRSPTLAFDSRVLRRAGTLLVLVV